MISDQVLAWREIAYGVTDKTTKTRKKYWEHWSGYCARFAIDPFLSNESKLQQIIILAGFAARVRTGTYGHGNQVKVQTVTEALAAISKTIELVGEQSPGYQAPNQYKLPLERLVEGFRREDPPAIPQLAVPVTVPNECQAFAEGQSDPGICATADLITIAFYYLLRVGEYTHPRRTKRGTQWIRTTRTKQFTVSDIGFFKDGNILPRSSPLAILLTADSATMKITNQKNGRMGQTIHHDGTDSRGGVAALARRVHHILQNGGNDDSLICDYFKNGDCLAVTPKHLIVMIRTAVKTLRLDTKGIDPDLVGVHSLRAGGAMALKLNDYSDTTIQKLGRWSSLTFLQYIHNQIAHLSSGIAAKMSIPLPFVNIAVIEGRTTPALD